MNKPYRLTITHEDGTYTQQDYAALTALRYRVEAYMKVFFQLGHKGKITITVERI